jgi:hypothetical protein
MGMLFNTDGTNQILQLANEAFNAAGLQRLKTANAGGAWTAAFTNVGTPPPPGASTASYNTIAKPLGIDLNVGSPTTGLKSLNWQKWLNYLDSHSNPGSANKISTDIGAAIVTALTQANPPYSQVEFFAIPTKPDTTKPNPYITATTQPYTDSHGNLSLIVTFYTCTVDELP